MSPSCYRAVMAIETLAPEWSGSTPEPGPIAATWLGRIDYHVARALQKRLAAERAVVDQEVDSLAAGDGQPAGRHRPRWSGRHAPAHLARR